MGQNVAEADLELLTWLATGCGGVAQEGGRGRQWVSDSICLFLILSAASQGRLTAYNNQYVISFLCLSFGQRDFLYGWSTFSKQHFVCRPVFGST